MLFRSNSYGIYFKHRFYELEDTFCKQNILDTYSHVVTNNKLNDISNIIQINSTKISVNIFLISAWDEISLDSDDDYYFISDIDNDDNNDDN